MSSRQPIKSCWSVVIPRDLHLFRCGLTSRLDLPTRDQPARCVRSRWRAGQLGQACRGRGGRRQHGRSFRPSSTSDRWPADPRP